MQIVIDITEEDYQNLKVKDSFNDTCLNYYVKNYCPNCGAKMEE